MKLRSYLTIIFTLSQLVHPAGARGADLLPVPKPEIPALLALTPDSGEEDATLADDPLAAAPTIQAADYMIVTANPVASQVGYDILSQGGTAADAAFAAQLVLGLVEPQSSGLGGGGFILYWDAAKKELTTYDGREMAPASATERLFLKKEDGTPMSFQTAVPGGLSVGIPGIPRLLDTIYAAHGKLPRQDIFQPALELSKYGFIASPRLTEMIEENKDGLAFFQTTKDYFLPQDDDSFDTFQNIKNPDYNATLFDFFTQGADVFYTGRIAANIQRVVNEAWYNPGLMTPEDFTAYTVKERPPVCGRYRTYRVCSMGEPSSGGLTLISALQMLDRFDLENYRSFDATAWHLIMEASRLAFADRNQYMADPDVTTTPGAELINPAYTSVRSILIHPDQVMKNAKAGKPLNWPATNDQAADTKQKNTGTTHISAIDRYGNAISFTSSIESPFGAKLMVDGFLLNNELTDFSFLPEKDGRKIANRPGPHKRPRSSMTPVIVFSEDHQPVLIIGSPGGSRIIGYVLQRIIGILDWHLPLEEALSSPNILTRGDKIEIERPDKRNSTLDKLEKELKTMGHKVTRSDDMTSGLSAILRHGTQWIGAADPRREGTVGQ